MTMKAWPALALPLLALAACDGAAERGAVAQPEPSASVAPAPEGTPAAYTPDIASKAIPSRFHGVWDAETGTCDPASDLRLAIGPEIIGFYESQGTVTGVTESGDGAIVIALAMEGEGEQWNQTVKLQLDRHDGRRWLLYLPGPDFDAVRQPIRRKRCPA